MSLLLALQISPIDEFLGLALAELIADIEPIKREDADFAICSRRGTNPATIAEIIKVMERRFARVFHIQGKRFGTGWPLGCNDLWAETMMGARKLKRAGSTRASGILTFEADCIPLRPNWIDLLLAGWRAARVDGLKVLGHKHDFSNIYSYGNKLPPDGSHINGNAIFEIGLGDKYPQIYAAAQAWDVEHKAIFLKHGSDTDLISQFYRITEPQPLQFVRDIRKFGKIPALFHGLKNDSGIQAIREMMKSGEFYDREKHSAHTQGPA